MEDEAVHIIKRHSKPGMHLPGAFKSLFYEPCVDKFSDEGGCNHLNTGFTDLLFDLFADFVCRIAINEGFPYEGI